jgi:tetratricopeptide (TPR) repeat protein
MPDVIATKETPEQAKHPFWLLWVLMLSAPIVFLVLLESGLRLFDYGESIPLFLPDKKGTIEYLKINPDIGFRYFRQQKHPPLPIEEYFRKEKPDNGYRIFMLGGSTAVGWPYNNNMAPSRLLERRLRDAFPDRFIEVINLGMTAVNTYTLLDFIDELTEQQPDAVLIYSGHNEYYGALGVGSNESLGRQRWLVQAYLKLQHFRITQLLRDTITLIQSVGQQTDSGGKKKSTTLMQRVVKEAIPYDSPLYWRGIRQYEANLREILEELNNAGVKVVLSELVSNLAGQSPLVSETKHNGVSAGELYLAAKQHEQNGQFDEAREKYFLAKEYDGLRFRAPEEINDVVHSLGDEFSVPVVTMKKYFEKASPNGIIGSNLMMEHLHPNGDGYFLMSEAFFDAIRQNKLISEQWPQELKPAGYYRDDWWGTEYDHVLARLRIRHLMDHWPFKSVEESGKNFRRYKSSGEIESLAMRVFQRRLNSIKAHRRLAKTYEKQGDIDAALREYMAIIGIFPFEVDYYRPPSQLLLGNDRFDEALVLLLRSTEIQPVPEAHTLIGHIYLDRDNLEQAISYFERALELSKEVDPMLIDLLAKAYLETGQHNKAKQLSNR